MVQVYKVKNRKTSGTGDPTPNISIYDTSSNKLQKSVKFAQSAEPSQLVDKSIVSMVQEKFPGFFEMPENCLPYTSDPIYQDDSEGFPSMRDFSSFFSNDKHKNSNNPNRSIFLQDFEECGRKAQNCDQQNVDSDPLNGGEKSKSTTSSTIENLEVIKLSSESSSNLTSEKKRQLFDSRLAADPIQMDIASKCSKNILLRKEQQLINIFDQLKNEPLTCDETEVRFLNRLARNSMESIKTLYLEEVLDVEILQKTLKFGNGVNPTCDPAWMLSPVRKILDAVQQRQSSNVPTQDDIEILRLTLLWSVLLLDERPSLFSAFIRPSEIYCRVAEIFLLGEEAFCDNIIQNCLVRFVEMIITEGNKGHLIFYLHKQIADLDAFMPFYEELLQKFEESCCGDENYPLILLIPAYMNNCLLDGILMAQQLWSLNRKTVRQMTLPKNKASKLIEYIRVNRTPEKMPNDDQQVFNEYMKLLALYASAIRDATVIRERNPLAFELASLELGLFSMRRNEENLQPVLDALRKVLDGKLAI